MSKLIRLMPVTLLAVALIACMRLSFPVEPEQFNSSSAPYLGKWDAPLTLVEYTDMTCIDCKRHETETLPQIVKAYVDPGKLKYVLRFCDPLVENAETVCLRSRGVPFFLLGQTQSSKPEMFIAIHKIQGAQPYATFKQAIDDMLMASGALK